MEILNVERTASVLIWIGAVLFSIYKVLLASRGFEHYHDIYGDFSQGWLVSGTKKDIADYEWESSLKVIKIIYPWLITHMLMAEVFRKVYKKALPYWYISISLLFIVNNLGIIGGFVLLLQPLLFHGFYKLKHKLWIWICGGICITLLTYLKAVNTSNNQMLHLNDIQHYMLVLAAYWITLRCLAFYIDSTDAGAYSTKYALAYCLYLPTLFTGPFIFFSDFEKAQGVITNSSLRMRIFALIFSIARFLFWIVFTEFALHYIYINAFGYQAELVKTFDNWTLYGYGYCMGQFFHLKYVVLYGLSTSLCQFEYIATPGTPKCIGRIHLYSDMWRYFDEGLYNFLTRYIYRPTLKKKTLPNKIGSSFLCFLFVYVWHGLYQHILVWTILNFIGICVESFCHHTSRSLTLWFHITKGEKQILLNILISPLLVLSAVSNFYFFAGMEIGNIFVEQFFKSTLWSKCILLFVLSCCCCISSEIKRWK